MLAEINWEAAHVATVIGVFVLGGIAKVLVDVGSLKAMVRPISKDVEQHGRDIKSQGERIAKLEGTAAGAGGAKR